MRTLLRGSLAILLLLGSQAAVAGDAKGLDLLKYCRQLYGDRTDLFRIQTDPNSWRCTQAIDMNAACASQYGAGYAAQLGKAGDANSWQCVEGAVKKK